MRNQAEWANKHRNGAVRARRIVTRQDTIHTIAKPSCISYNQHREMARRKRQIKCGQLKAENGLVV